MGIGLDIGQGLGSIGAGIANLVGAAGEGGERYYNKAIQAWKKLEASNFDMTALDAPELRAVAEVFPELYEAVVPEQAEQIAGSPEMRAQQAESLAAMRDVGREGMTDVDRLAANRAQTSMAMGNRRSVEGALRSLAARGQLGAGDELAARMASQQAQATTAGDMGAQLAEQAALRRIGAVSEAERMAGGIRGQDVQEQSRNAELSQRFNELVYNTLNQAAQQNAAARERAQGWNAANRQGIADQNEVARYKAALENLTRQNALRDTEFGQNLAITQGMTGAYGTKGAYEDRQQANRMAGIQGIGEGAGGVIGGITDLAFGGGGQQQQQPTQGVPGAQGLTSLFGAI